jgi:hypothetical protein
MSANPVDQSKGPLSTVLISLLSAALGAVGGHLLDFLTTRELNVREERAAAVERVWNETGDMYRQLFAMRPRLIGSILAYRQAVIELEAARMRSALANPSTPLSPDYAKAVDVARQAVVDARSQLELLLGWAELAAPAGDTRWHNAVQALIEIGRWAPSQPPANLASLGIWRQNELSSAHDSCTAELNPKFATLLRLVKARRESLDHALANQPDTSK